jgi:hypothetical protein
MPKNNITISLAVINHKGKDYFYLGGKDYEDVETGEVFQFPEITTANPENFRGFRNYNGNNFFDKETGKYVKR